MSTTRLKSLLLSLSAVVVMSAGMAHAATNLVTNGNFDDTTNGNNKRLSASPTNEDDRTTLSGWTSTSIEGNGGGYNFVLDANTAKTWDSVIWLRSEVDGVSNGYASSANGGNIFCLLYTSPSPRD